jgi:hypothetical protein
LLRGDSAGGARRLVVLDVIDVSPEHSLTEVASAMTDSLVQGLRRRPNTRVLSGKRLEDLEKRFGSDEMLGLSLGASGVLRSSLGMRRDTLTLFVALFDSRTQRYVRSFRTMAPRGNPEELSRKMLPMIQEWLDRTPHRPAT